MTNTSKKLPVQAFARVGALALFAAALASGCGSSDDSSGNGSSAGTGASAGKAGSTSKAGSAGTMTNGEAGESTGATGGSSTTGGSSNTGGTSPMGTAGAEEGGEAGTGMTGSVCGNGKVEAGEECDDGNTKSGDGCSSTCKNLCEKCEAKQCFTNPVVGATSDLCYGMLGDAPASAGPAAGSPKSQLCQSLIECMRKSQCAQSHWQLPFNACYCGDEAFADCKTTPKGPCVEEMAEAAESRDFNDIARVWGNGVGTIAAGAASQIVTLCDQVACPAECFQDKAPTKCQACTATFDVQANNIPCAARYGDCYVAGPAATTDPSNAKQLSMTQLCAPASDCAQRTGCAANGVDSCYGNGSGPCAAEFAAAADSTDPATVLNRMHNFYYPATVAAQLIECQATECQSDCLPTSANGGTGGTGSAGTGGASTGGGNGGTGG